MRDLNEESACGLTLGGELCATCCAPKISFRRRELLQLQLLDKLPCSPTHTAAASNMADFILTIDSDTEEPNNLVAPPAEKDDLDPDFDFDFAGGDNGVLPGAWGGEDAVHQVGAKVRRSLVIWTFYALPECCIRAS